MHLATKRECRVVREKKSIFCYIQFRNFLLLLLFLVSSWPWIALLPLKITLMATADSIDSLHCEKGCWLLGFRIYSDVNFFSCLYGSVWADSSSYCVFSRAEQLLASTFHHFDQLKLLEFRSKTVELMLNFDFLMRYLRNGRWKAKKEINFKSCSSKLTREKHQHN